MAVTVRSRIEAATRTLREHGQEHVLRFMNELEREEQLALLEDIESLDVDLLDRLIDECVLNPRPAEVPTEITPPKVYPAHAEDEATRQRYAQAMQRGEKLIDGHKVAAFTVAGGQGTRLNIDGPKGNVPATPVRNKPLFRVFAESLIAVQRRFNCVVPWYIMTSQANHQETVDTFEKNDYFCLNPKDVMFFSQGMMPAIDMQGKLLLGEKHRLAMAPNGHGGSLKALYDSGALQDMAKRGIEYISYFQIDNPLVTTIDPLFLGLHAMDTAEMSSKAVKKCSPEEKVGIFAMRDGKLQVIEYSDLPEELACKQKEDGSLLFEFGSIAIHIINRSFVERLNRDGFSLPWHRATKKVPCVNDAGERIEPSEPNAVKLETFVFDALPLADKSATLEVVREDEFAPIKNATGSDSLVSSQHLQTERAARWMEKAGIEVPRKDDGTVDAMIEISPLFALNDHELTDKRRQLRPLKRGDIVYLG